MTELFLHCGKHQSSIMLLYTLYIHSARLKVEIHYQTVLETIPYQYRL